MKLILCNLLVLIGMASVAFGADVPGVSAADFPTSPEAHWIYALLASPIFAALLAWVVKYVDGWIRDRAAMREYVRLRDAYTFVSYGVDQTWKGFVRALKAGLEDDQKLSEQDKNAALAKAKETAIAYAKTHGVDLIKTVGPQMIELLIEKVIGDRKAGKIILAPLPDLGPSAPSV